MTELKIYFNHLLLYDYIAFGGIFLLFILLFILAILASSKKVIFVFLLLLSFATLFALPVVSKLFIDQKIRTTIVTQGEHKNLVFAKTLIVFVDIANKGKVDFSECRVKVKVIKNASNDLKAFVNKYKPKRVKIENVGSLKKDESREVRVVISDYNLDENHHLISSGYCY